MLSIAVAGFLMLLTGLFLYLFRNEVSGNVRFVMPIPPLVVAAYIFVFNLYRHYNGNLPEGTWSTIKEIIYSTAVAAMTFAIFTILLVVIINYIKR